jgi:hypothetical protein
MECIQPTAHTLAAGRSRADHRDVTDPYDLRAAVERLLSELETGAASLGAVGNQEWPRRLRSERDALADVTTADLDRLMETVDGASKAMQAAGLGQEALKLAWSIIDALVIEKNVRHANPARPDPQ